MKKIFHKNQVVITSLAILIAIAGYVSYDKKNQGEEDLLVANTDLLTSDQVAAGEDTDGEFVDVLSTELDAIDNPGETIFTSAEVSGSEYAASVKLNREQIRSRNREMLQAIIDNESLNEAQKQEAVDEMIRLTEISEKEADAEMMLKAKGYSNAVVSIGEDCCDVVLEMDAAKDDTARAQVEDIVKRKTGIPAENIVITPMK